MTQKLAKKNGYARATLADIAREMAKPRLAESVREAAEIAELEDSHLRRPPGTRVKGEV
jgi:hypothetical protein